MESIDQKAHFLQYEYTEILSGLDADAPRKWGKMNVQQMIEHMSDYMRIANGRTLMEIVTPEERIPAMQAFLEGEKQMRENTPNPLMPEIPAPARHMTKDDAISELQQEIDHFFEVHQNEAGRITANPFFGNLTFEQQVKLLYKHSTHHLRQFGAIDYN